jgi:hypothetical protein
MEFRSAGANQRFSFAGSSAAAMSFLTSSKT